MKECRLTTFDNPYDPFDQFIDWFMFDTEKGYNTCGKIARLTESVDSLTQIEELAATERAIDKIVTNDFLNVYKKVTKETVEY